MPQMDVPEPRKAPPISVLSMAAEGEVSIEAIAAHLDTADLPLSGLLPIIPFAEIGAGQETANWFFRASGTAGLVAKTISAYDMTMSDEIYGKTGRYVSAERLSAMLQHEYGILLDRLAPKRGTHRAELGGVGRLDSVDECLFHASAISVWKLPSPWPLQPRAQRFGFGGLVFAGHGLCLGWARPRHGL